MKLSPELMSRVMSRAWRAVLALIMAAASVSAWAQA